MVGQNASTRLWSVWFSTSGSQVMFIIACLWERVFTMGCERHKVQGERCRLSSRSGIIPLKHTLGDLIWKASFWSNSPSHLSTPHPKLNLIILFMTSARDKLLQVSKKIPHNCPRVNGEGQKWAFVNIIWHKFRKWKRHFWLTFKSSFWPFFSVLKYSNTFQCYIRMVRDIM